MKNKVIRIFSIALALIVGLPSVIMLSGCSVNTNTDSGNSEASLESSYVSFENGFTDEVIKDEKDVIAVVGTVASELGLTEPEKELKMASVSEVNGNKYYRMQQYYEDIPVYGRTVVLGVDGEGRAIGMTANTVALEKVKTTPKATLEKINASISSYCKENFEYEPEDDIVKDADEMSLAIYFDEKNTVLVYVVCVNFKEFLVDASNAKIINAFDTLYEDSVVKCYNADGSESFIGYYNDNDGRYIAYNKEREIRIGNYLKKNSKAENVSYEYLCSDDEYFGNIKNGNTEEKDKGYSEGVTFANIVIPIYDYYKDKFGDTAYGRLVACYNDGYYNGENGLGGRDSLGNGYISLGYKYTETLDIIAHEYTHVVSRNKVNWINVPAWSSQRDESGAINEAYSDIFGELIEAKLKKKAPDWKHNDSRDIKNPHNSNLPAATGEIRFEEFTNTENKKYWGISVGSGTYVDYSHGASTVISHAAYLMWNGIDGKEAAKINEDALAELWYRALLMLQSNATFKQCANAVVLAARQMHQENPEKFTVNMLSCVKEAFSKVGIRIDDSAFTVANGAVIYAIERDGSKKYDNYHILIEAVDLKTRTTNTVAQADITDENGYTINLPDGKYVVTVTDNAENGSEYKYKKTIDVKDILSKASSIRQNTQPIEQKVYIYTDFKAKIPATDFSIQEEMIITLGELSVIKPVITPADADGYRIKWSSSNESVATVAPNGEAGIVTALSKGTSVITAEMTSGGKTIIKTTNLRVASKARDTVLVLDVSGSMAGTPLSEMKKSAIQFCNDLLEDEYNNRVGIVFYDDELYEVGMSDDLDYLVREIQAIGTGGTTNMTAALEAADVMLSKNSKALNSVKNVVIMADGIPNEGERSNSGSLPSGSYSSYTSSVEYANAVIDKTENMKSKYNVYSLGFFHGLSGISKDFATALMRELTNKSDGYYQVDKAEDLQFAFGDISEEISYGSRIVINIACPVAVKVSYGNEKLSSLNTDYCDVTSFGSLQLLGENKDIKVVSLDSDKIYKVELVGTGEGQMDYSICYFNEQEQLTDSRSFEAVPITATTLIKTDTDNSSGKNICLDIDEDGDGEIDYTWGAAANQKGVITYRKAPVETEPETVAPVDEPPTEPETNSSSVTLIIVLICVLALAVIGGIAAVIAGTSSKNKSENEFKSSQKSGFTVPEKLESDAVTCPVCGKSHAKNTPCDCEKREVESATTKLSGSIKLTSGSMKGFCVPIKDGEQLYIGKDARFANVVLSSDYKKVSRVHCSVVYNAKNASYYVIDSSSNGTYYKNGVRFVKGKRTAVKANSTIMLADADCTVLLG